MKLLITWTMMALYISTGMGCLVTDPIEPSEIPQNHAPLIDEKTAFPKNNLVINFRDGWSCTQIFYININDIDENNTITVRWLIDGYQDDSDQGQQYILPNNHVYRGKAEFKFNVSDYLLGEHVLKVEVDDSYDKTVYAWFIDTTLASYCLNQTQD